MDFDERYRADVIRYAAEKYGSDHVAQIVTFSTIKGKQALRDAARVLGYPYGVGDRAAKLMPPPILGRDAALGMCLDPLPEDADGNTKDWHANASGLREAYATDPDIRSVADVARNLEGLRRQDSIHAAAVVISPVPLTEHIPIQQKGDGAEVVTQYEMHAIEDLGLLKMDFLGLRNLSIMERTLELIEASSAESGSAESAAPAGRPMVDIDNVPLDDEITFELLRSAQTIGVFQLEGSAMRGLIRNLAPDRFEDVIALVALYRPGPMRAGMHTLYADRKNGRAAVEVLHPDMAPILERSYGIMVYQEQVLQVAEVMAGYSMAEAENLRRAMGKKIPAVMRAEEEKFVAGCTARGHSEALGETTVRADRALRRLRVQPGPCRLLRAHRIPDGVAQGALPRRVHGGDAHRHQEGQGPDGGVPQRVPRHGCAGPHPRRQHVADGLLGVRGAISGSGCLRSATSARGWSSGSSRNAPPASRSPTSRTSSTG